jgi:hypothetical protein
MNHLIVSITLLLYIMLNYAQAEVIQTSSLIPIETAVNNSNEHTLLIFDVQEVLMVAQDQVLTPAHKVERKKIKQQLLSHLPTQDTETIESIILMDYKPVLVDPDIVNLIALAKSKQIKTLALTSGYTGKFGKIDNRENLRIEKLKALGIDFSSSFPQIPTLSFLHLQDLHHTKYTPMFKQGIIFTCRLPKGEVLEAFLIHVKSPVKKIIFVDNRLKNIMSVESFCKSNGIEFQGFVYEAVKKRPKSPLDQQLAIYQFNTLVKQHHWFSELEIQAQLKQ